MTKGKEVIKKNKVEWQEHKWIWEVYPYTMIYKKDNFHITHESSDTFITNGEFK